MTESQANNICGALLKNQLCARSLQGTVAEIAELLAAKETVEAVMG